MPRKKGDNKQELLRKKRIAEKERRDKIKSNPELYKQYLEKEKARYAQRKEAKKLLSINELTPRCQRIQRKKWKTNQQNLRARKSKLKKLLQKDTPPVSEPEDNPANMEEQPFPSYSHSPQQHSPKSKINPSDELSGPYGQTYPKRHAETPICNPFDGISGSSHDCFPKRPSISFKSTPSSDFPGSSRDHSPKRLSATTISHPLNELPGPSRNRFPKRLPSSSKSNPSDELPGPSNSRFPESISSTTKSNLSDVLSGPAHSRSHKKVSTTEKIRLYMARKLRYEISKNEVRYRKSLLEIKQQNKSLLRCVRRLRQTIEKMKAKTGPRSPGTEAEILIADPTKKEEVKKAILFKEIVQNNLNNDYEKQTKCEKRKMKENIEPIRNKLKKYNLLQELPKITRKSNTKEQDDNRKAKIDSDLKAFYEDDKNSRITSGKKECITLNKQKEQKRFLNDTLTNLHKKFLGQHGYDVSYSYFCKARPYWVIAPSEKDRETCKCKIHDNVDLLAKALSTNKIILEKSSKEIISTSVCDIYNLKCMERKCSICVNRGPTILDFDNNIELNYYMWGTDFKEVGTKHGTRRIRITEKKQHNGKPKEVLLLLLNLVKKLYVHTANIVNQYDCTTSLKKSPEDNSVVIHMDFSENYSAKYNTEIQSLHFGGSRTQITLHTSVLYISGCPKPTSFCTYSDSVRHDALAVWGHIIPLLDFIEKTAPETDTLHFMTDSTCSQYRNKTINYIITKLHWYLPNLKTVTWNYSEAGHGKGAPDGVGGTIKRTADNIIRQGKDIPDIDTFAKEIKNSVKNVILEYISEYNIIEKELLMPSQLLKPFKGMMQVHQIVWDKNNTNKIALRRQTCLLDMCKNFATACPHGKHLGFYSNPIEEPCHSKLDKVVIISNVLLQPSHKLKSHTNTQYEFQTHLPQRHVNDVQNDEDLASYSLPEVRIERPDEHVARICAKIPIDMEIPMDWSEIPDNIDKIDDELMCSTSNVTTIQRSGAFLARSHVELPSDLQISTDRPQISDTFDDSDDELKLCYSSNVAMIQRSEPFLAQTQAELPRDLQISPNILQVREKYEPSDEFASILSLDVTMNQSSDRVLFQPQAELPIGWQMSSKDEGCHVDFSDNPFNHKSIDKHVLTSACLTLAQQSLMVVNNMLTISSDKDVLETRIKTLQTVVSQKSSLYYPGNGSSVSAIRSSLNEELSSQSFSNPTGTLTFDENPSLSTTKCSKDDNSNDDVTVLLSPSSEATNSSISKPSTSKYKRLNSVTKHSQVITKKNNLTTKASTESLKINKKETSSRKKYRNITSDKLRKQNTKGLLPHQKSTRTRRGKGQDIIDTTDSEDSLQLPSIIREYSEENKNEEEETENSLSEDNVHEGDWVVVNFVSERNVLHRFVGQVVKESLTTFEVKFAKKINDKKFKWPDKTDICEIGKYQVVRKLTPPCFKSSSKRIGAFEFIRSLKQLKIDK